MSGIALRVDGCDFSSSNLGNVTSANEPLSDIVISTSGEFKGHKVLMSVEYTPSTTSQKGIIWSIDTGDEYALIDSNGVLRINPSANNNTVIVRATSIYNEFIYTTTKLTVTYIAPVLFSINSTLSNAISSNHDSSIESEESYYTVLSSEEGYDITNIAVTMGSNDISNSVVTYPDIMNKTQAIINIPVVTGNIYISNSSCRVYYQSVSEGDLLTGNINGSNSTSGTAKFLHLKTIPAMQRDVLKVYFPPTRETGYISPTYVWTIKFIELNKAETPTSGNQSSYIQNTPIYSTVQIPNNSEITTFEYEIESENTVSCYIQFTLDRNGTSQACTLSASYGRTFNSSIATGWGNVFINNGDPCFKVTINEDTTQV